MKIRSIKTTPRFERSFAKLSPDLQKSLIRQKRTFMSDPFSSPLKTHKLTGKLKSLWSFSISYSHRVLFEFLGDEMVIFHDVGDHSIYQ